MLRTHKSTALVCHDAGATNQILAMVLAGDIIPQSAHMTGPAATLSKTALPSNIITDNLEDALKDASVLISGTGWSSPIEHDGRQLAKKLGIYSIAVIDHWVNYRDRFVRNGITVLPDEIWVVDEYALSLAKQIFTDITISLKTDRYANEELRKITPVSSIHTNELLYLLEPVRSNWGKAETGEIQALRYFLDRRDLLGIPKDTKLCLRPHPSETCEKYTSFLSAREFESVCFDTGNLHDAISRAKWVAGCQTYALTIALKSGRIVYGTLPPWAPKCPLPHNGIVHICNLDHP
jgi:hypothetical protein